MFHKVCIIITLLTYNPPKPWRNIELSIKICITQRAEMLFSCTIRGWMNGKSMENGLKNIWRAETFISFTFFFYRVFIYICDRAMMYYRTRQWWYVFEINLLCCGLGCFVGKKDCLNANVMVTLQSWNVLLSIYTKYVYWLCTTIHIMSEMIPL